MIVNVDNGKIDKECGLNRSYECCGCVNYYDESDTVCKRGCIHYIKYLKERGFAVEVNKSNNPYKE